MCACDILVTNSPWCRQWCWDVGCIVFWDLRDNIVQALALFTCHRDTLTVLENLPMNKWVMHASWQTCADCTHMHTHTCPYTHTHAHVRPHKHTHTQACMHAHTHTYIYMCAFILSLSFSLSLSHSLYIFKGFQAPASLACNLAKGTSPPHPPPPNSSPSPCLWRLNKLWIRSLV